MKTGFKKPDTQQIKISMKGPDVGDEVFLAGNFNDWQAADPRFKMQYLSPGHYQLNLSQNISGKKKLEYKYVRKGGWNFAEVDRYGNKIENRVLDPKNSNIEDEVDRWLENGQYFSENYYPKIKIISEKFEIPQLIKTRRITALLPYDYYESDAKYPVLYLQDGQNLFDDNAPFGSWEVDKKLAVLNEMGMGDIIVIAIDHAKEERINEFSPVEHDTNKGVAEGRKYVKFLAETLKPYIDQNFRTMSDAPNTGIGGSSLGGLISIYAGSMYPEVFSKLMIFSPSLWMAPEMKFNPEKYMKPMQTKIYLYAGGNESKTMVSNIKSFQKRVKYNSPADSKISFKLSIDPHGTHSERHWGEEFPIAVKWLYYNPLT